MGGWLPGGTVCTLCHPPAAYVDGRTADTNNRPYVLTSAYVNTLALAHPHPTPAAYGRTYPHPHAATTITGSRGHQ